MGEMSGTETTCLSLQATESAWPEREQLSSVTIPLEAISDLRDFCVRRGVSTSLVVQIAWGAVLRSYSGDDEVRFGLLLRCTHNVRASTCYFNFASAGTLDSLLGDISGGLAHQNYSRDELEGPSVPRMFQTALIIPDSSPGICKEGRDAASGYAKISVEPEMEAAVLRLQYVQSTLCEKQALNIATTLRHALVQMIRKPFKNIRDINMCGKESIDQIAEWNKRTPKMRTSCIHQVIYRQCLDHPDRLAVQSWDGALTYKDLDSLATHLAMRLTAAGVGPEVFVPLFFEKSIWAVVAVLGVIKAGGAYVFLSPEDPIPRLRSICDDIDASIMVTSRGNLATCKQLATGPFFVLEAESSKHLLCEMTSSFEVRPDNALYAVFTSGSTGKPKGVIMEHGSFHAAVMANIPSLRISAESRVLQFANFIYDAANRDILLTLMCGGCICMPSESERQNDIENFTRTYDVNWASLTPSVASLLEPKNVPGLRTLLLGGESMTSTLVAAWSQQVDLLNGYGPCEGAALTSLHRHVHPQSDATNIGRGIGALLWVVDASDPNRLAPVGAIGELLIESPAVGRGYINNHLETAKRFLKHTDWSRRFGSESGSFYLTGDLARYNPDGTLAFVGRKDTQVKIQGRRVELGEIERHIERHIQREMKDYPTKTVVEVIHPEGTSAAKLVAYVALGEQANTAPEQARRHWAR